MKPLHMGMGTAKPTASGHAMISTTTALTTACPSGSSLTVAGVPRHANKKADAVEHPEVFDHVGLLFNEPPGATGLPFI